MYIMLKKHLWRNRPANHQKFFRRHVMHLDNSKRRLSRTSFLRGKIDNVGL